MKKLAGFVLVGWLVLTGGLTAREFTVLVYNVENLFDLDGVSAYNDYRQDQGEHGYGLEPFLRKVRHVGDLLAEVDTGRGPDIIMFQEIELDRTPFSTVEDAGRFLAENSHHTLEEMLRENSRHWKLPATYKLLKHLEDRGMGGYHVAEPDTFLSERHPAHINVVFSRFPIISQRQRSMHDARDLLEVTVDVDGHPLILLNNHWKSGASNAALEPVRIQNAHKLRARVDAILLENPRADVILAGDFNSHYNQMVSVPGVERCGIICVLGSQGDELALRSDGGPDLYNLWFELPREQRGSEVWRGRWGTLMQILVTRGLYDRQGIQYVDNSFFRIKIPGLNVDPHLHRPVAWTSFGGGGGYTDHLPIGAVFRVVAEEDRGEGFKSLKNPSRETRLTDYLHPVDFAGYVRENGSGLPSAESLAGVSYSELAQLQGRLYRIDTRIFATRPVKIKIGERQFSLHSFDPPTLERLRGLREGDRLEAYADFGFFRNRPQFIIQDPSWWLK